MSICLCLGSELILIKEGMKIIPAYFVIERGLPYEPGTPLVLEKENIMIGRSDNNNVTPDISFNSLFISREHCCVRYVDGEWYLLDIKGKRGTTINGKKAEVAQSYRLQDGDRITLAENTAVIRFIAQHNRHKTFAADRWFSQMSTITDVIEPFAPYYEQPLKNIKIDIDKMELYVKGQCIPLSPKEWRLLELLYQNCNKVVDYESIMLAVWPEREKDEDNQPYVTQEEVNLLIYRLRGRMGECKDRLKVKRGRGCILDC